MEITQEKKQTIFQAWVMTLKAQLEEDIIPTILIGTTMNGDIITNSKLPKNILKQYFQKLLEQLDIEEGGENG